MPFPETTTRKEEEVCCPAIRKSESSSTLCTVDADESETNVECDESDDDVFLGRKLVKWTKSLTVCFIPGLSTYTDKEVRRCWYSPKDKMDMEMKRNEVIARMESGKPPRTSKPYRGLEHWTEKGTDQITRDIEQRFTAVMDEQERQWRASKDDFDRIAEISQSFSAINIIKALLLARQDEKEADEIYNVDDDQDDRYEETDTTSSSNREQPRSRGKNNKKNRKPSKRRSSTTLRRKEQVKLEGNNRDDIIAEA